MIERQYAEERDEQVGFDPARLLMKDGAQSQVALERAKGFLDRDELHVVPPEFVGVASGHVGAQQVAAFADADAAQPGLVEGVAQGLRADPIGVLLWRGLLLRTFRGSVSRCSLV